MDSDSTKINKLVNSQLNHPNVKIRIRYNVEESPVVPSKAEFWEQMVTCLLTSQQRSTPGSAIEKFAQMTPSPLSLATCESLTSAQMEHVIGSNGLRFGKRISGFLRGNLEWISKQDKGWPQLQALLTQLAEQRAKGPESNHKNLERSVARYVDDALSGIGPKQSRNLLQELGLTRYEIPLDSRVAGWLKQNLGWNIEIGELAHQKYYEEILDRVQGACEKANVLPAVFDAAAFVTGKDRSKPAGTTTQIGFVNRNGQVVIRSTGLPGSDFGQTVYQLGCSKCGHVYGANGSDIFERKCSTCQGGASGLAYEG